MTLALTVGAAASTILASAATAHADPEYLLFTDPTGNVKCEMTINYKGNPYANCVVRHAAYPVLADKCDFPGPVNPQIGMGQGDTPDYSCVVASDNTPGEFTLDFGQTRSVGTITWKARSSASLAPTQAPGTTSALRPGLTTSPDERRAET